MVSPLLILCFLRYVVAVGAPPFHKILKKSLLPDIMNLTFVGGDLIKYPLVKPISPTDKMLQALYVLENFSTKRSKEFLFISKRIRKDIWNGTNAERLCYLMESINSIYSMFREILGEDVFSELNMPGEYIRLLGRYRDFYGSSLPSEYYLQFLDDLQLYSASLIIEEQWQHITSAEDGLKAFIEIFDDVFSQCIDVHKDKFFHALSETDVLCRAVKGTGHDKDRFIPWPSKTHDRWNPPNTQFLYLSFDTRVKPYSDTLTLNEYICLLELRATKGQVYSICDFQAVTPGNVLDLSYNDMTIADTRRIIDQHYDDVFQKVLDDLLKTPQAVSNAKAHKKDALMRDIQKSMENYPFQREVLEEAYAKQYLIMVCSCIYKKVDETDEDKKALAYKSFQILCQYLREKGVTGIIYPCTRTKDVIGKNLVLFNVNDAIPLEHSIRERLYE